MLTEVQAALDHLRDMSNLNPDLGIIVGTPLPTGRDTGRGNYNAAVVIHQGEIIGVQHKTLLPTYDVFDEDRYFEPPPTSRAGRPSGRPKLGITICEDAWNDRSSGRAAHLHVDPVAELAQAGRRAAHQHLRLALLAGQAEVRDRLVTRHARTTAAARSTSTRSAATTARSSTAAASRSTARASRIVRAAAVRRGRLASSTSTRPPATRRPPSTPERWPAVLRRAGARARGTTCASAASAEALLGLSGGIDSAVDLRAWPPRRWARSNVLGVGHALAVFLRRQRRRRRSDLAENLGIRFDIMPIEPIYDAYMNAAPTAVRGHAAATSPRRTSRRASAAHLLMALSNKYGSLVLATGNKSELAVGYCTLYGDMCGGLAVIGDVPKTHGLRAGALHQPRTREIIPQAIIDKPPSAELRARPDGPGHPAAVRHPRRRSQSYVEDDLCSTRSWRWGCDPDVVR